MEKLNPGRLIAGGMLRENTPIEDYRKKYGLWVKREDLSCPKPGPPFSKTRGVYERVKSREEGIIGVLDTYHSQAGHAVARACEVLGKTCVNFYPEFKYEPGPRLPQLRAEELGAELYPLVAGRSCILFHQAKKITLELGGYMMPNALQLTESVRETAKECRGIIEQLAPTLVIIPASSGTIAAGVIKGLGSFPSYVVHLGYSRSHEEVRKYLDEQSGVLDAKVELIDEGYGYKDKAKPGEVPPWPCNEYYDLKAFRWWMANRDKYKKESVLMWNIG